MAKENKTIYAILGLLASKPMTGYDIKKSFENGIDFMWSENYGHIYPMLQRMEKEQLISRINNNQTSLRKKYEYQILEKGQQYLEEWLYRPINPVQNRDEFLLKLIFSRYIPTEASITAIAKRRKASEALYISLKAIEERILVAIGENKALTFDLLTVQLGIKQTETFISWCDESIQRLEKLKEDIGK